MKVKKTVLRFGKYKFGEIQLWEIQLWRNTTLEKCKSGKMQVCEIMFLEK